MKKWIITGVGVAVITAIVSIVRTSGKKGGDDEMPVAVAQQGDLVIDVLEGGNIQALNFLEYRNEVKLPNGIKILEIIEEGYYVTEEDVAKGKILVRLDQSELEEEIVDHDVEFQQTEALYAEAKQNIEIQESESLSEIKSERQKLRFALLDFQKFVGADAARETLKKLGLPYDNDTLAIYEKEATDLIVKAFETRRGDGNPADSEEGTEVASFALVANDSLAANVNFSSFLNEAELGDGEAEQTIRRMRDEALLATSELALVEESVEGAKRLHQREFITKQTLENELVGLDKLDRSFRVRRILNQLLQFFPAVSADSLGSTNSAQNGLRYPPGDRQHAREQRIIHSQSRLDGGPGHSLVEQSLREQRFLDK